jgi:hypothetical protein
VASHTYGKMPVVHHTIVTSLGYLILAQSASRCTRLQIEALTMMKLSMHNKFQYSSVYGDDPVISSKALPS